MKLSVALNALLPGWVKRPADVVEAIKAVRDYCRKKALETHSDRAWTTLGTILDVAADQAEKQV